MISISEALYEESQTMEDNAEKEISIETDARHACRKNSYHSDVVALGKNTHEVVSIIHVTKKDETCSQKHEAYGVEKMYEEFEQKGFKIKDHAHDRNTSVNKIIKSKQGPSSTNDRWHAVKAITKGMKDLGMGAQKNRGVTWHPQLTDKVAATKNHIYWAIENCDSNATTLRAHIDNSLDHFQGNHENCHTTSHCKYPGYMSTTLLLDDPVAIRLLQKFLKSSTLYKFAEDYVRCRDTYTIESFYNTVLMYLDKRIHYKENTNGLRQSFAVLDWNEHSNRPYTSRSNGKTAQHVNRQKGKKNYTKKTYSFVDKIFQMLSSSNQETSGQ